MHPGRVWNRVRLERARNGLRGGVAHPMKQASHLYNVKRETLSRVAREDRKLEAKPDRPYAHS